MEAVEGFWPIFFLIVVLKIPVLGSIWLVWWASQPAPDADAAEERHDPAFWAERREEIDAAARSAS